MGFLPWMTLLALGISSAFAQPMEPEVIRRFPNGRELTASTRWRPDGTTFTTVHLVTPPREGETEPSRQFIARGKLTLQGSDGRVGPLLQAFESPPVALFGRKDRLLVVEQGGKVFTIPKVKGESLTTSDARMLFHESEFYLLVSLSTGEHDPRGVAGRTVLFRMSDGKRVDLAPVALDLDEFGIRDGRLLQRYSPTVELKSLRITAPAFDDPWLSPGARPYVAPEPPAAAGAAPASDDGSYLAPKDWSPESGDETPGALPEERIRLEKFEPLEPSRDTPAPGPGALYDAHETCDPRRLQEFLRALMLGTPSDN